LGIKEAKLRRKETWGYLGIWKEKAKEIRAQSSGITKSEGVFCFVGGEREERREKGRGGKEKKESEGRLLMAL
jgi:hypothetical protein